MMLQSLLHCQLLCIQSYFNFTYFGRPRNCSKYSVSQLDICAIRRDLASYLGSTQFSSIFDLKCILKFYWNITPYRTYDVDKHHPFQMNGFCSAIVEIYLCLSANSHFLLECSIFDNRSLFNWLRYTTRKTVLIYNVLNCKC